MALRRLLSCSPAHKQYSEVIFSLESSRSLERLYSVSHQDATDFGMSRELPVKRASGALSWAAKRNMLVH
jgi:hypothetical protein